MRKEQRVSGEPSNFQWEVSWVPAKEQMEEQKLVEEPELQEQETRSPKGTLADWSGVPVLEIDPTLTEPQD